jgi:PAS domain S-box-containing protein
MMKDSSKTNQELIAEISVLNKRIRELELTSSEKMREESERRARQLTVLHETSVALTAELDLDVLLHSITERALNLIGGAACNCYLVNPQTDLLERVASAGTGLVPSPKTRQRGEGMVGQVWVNGTPMLVNDYASWSGRTRAYDSFPSRALMAAPFLWGTEILGVLNIMALLPHQYTQMNVDMLSLFAAQAAIAIRNARLHDRMKMELAERNRAEKELHSSEDKYRNILENIKEGYFEVDLAGNITFFNTSLCRILGYPREEMQGMNNRVFMDFENAKNVFRAFNEVYVSGIPKKGFGFETIRKDDTRAYVELSVSLIATPREKPTGFSGIARDVTECKKAEKELQHTLDSLRRAVGATIQVMVSAVETRDPYTAGHQLRSAALARTIATEMGLSQDKIDAIRMAGSIHDIGKLSIPAEILSKPTDLSEIEFSLIKEHARKGFKMLKDVESPWPLAEIIYQHHERMDGSGYPRNLKGEEIIIDARILAVADVVEAMASHRPYRPGLGIDAALTEIEKNKGIFYDDTVADACLRLFREKDCRLEGARF